MRFRVKLKKNENEFEEIIIANNKKEAINMALKNNPKAIIKDTEWTYKFWELISNKTLENNILTKSESFFIPAIIRKE